MTPEEVKQRRLRLKFLSGCVIDHADCLTSGKVLLQVSKGDRQYLISFLNHGPTSNYEVLGIPGKDFWPDSPPKKE